MLVASAMVIAGCGGGSGGGSAATSDTTITTDVAEGLGGDGSETISRGSTSTTPLEIASRVSVVDSTESAQRYGGNEFAKSVMRAISAGTIAGWADSVDYNQDVTQVWVNDKSSDSFEMINSILCSFEQTRYDAMINAGPYIAQVDVQLCEQNSADSKSASRAGEGQSSVTVPEYEYWVVDSLRETEDGVQVVYAWIPNEEDYGEDFSQESVIMARIVIYKGESAEYPNGLFTMNFKQVPYISGTKQIDPASTAGFAGILKSFVNTNGENLISFSMENEMALPEEFYTSMNLPVGSDVVEMDEYVIMAKKGDGSGGGAAYMREVFPEFNFGPAGPSGDFEMHAEESTYNIAFNANYFLRQDVDTGAQSCYARTNPKRNVFRYGLYDANGARVNLSSGIPIGYVNSQGRTIQGHAGYWGIWIDGMEGEIEMSSLDGQVVSKFDWSNNTLDTTKQYTINVTRVNSDILRGTTQLSLRSKM